MGSVLLIVVIVYYTVGSKNTKKGIMAEFWLVKKSPSSTVLPKFRSKVSILFLSFFSSGLSDIFWSALIGITCSF